jgi:outer membrane PBP1 activator LpoA protein
VRDFPAGRSSGTAPNTDQLDKAGQTILQLVSRAAGIADENGRHALDMAQQLSDQLRAAEDRVAELEAEIAASRERCDRAEQWLHRIYSEIESAFSNKTALGGRRVALRSDPKICGVRVEVRQTSLTSGRNRQRLRALVLR